MSYLKLSRKCNSSKNECPLRMLHKKVNTSFFLGLVKNEGFILGTNYKAEVRLLSMKVWLFTHAFDKYVQIIDKFPFSLRKWMIYYNTAYLNKRLDTRCQFITADNQLLYSIPAEK